MAPKAGERQQARGFKSRLHLVFDFTQSHNNQPLGTAGEIQCGPLTKAGEKKEPGIGPGVSPSVGTGKGVQERDHKKGGERPSRGWNWGLEVAK